MELKSLVEDGRATEWRVTSRDGRYAQVAVRGRPFSKSVGADDADRPFRIYGDFSDQELTRLLAYVRSSPRKPPIPDDADGTSHAQYPDRLDGRVPVLQVRRMNRNTAEVWMGEPGLGRYAVLHYRTGAWHLGEIADYIS